MDFAPEAAPKVTTKKSEWHVGGIVGGRTEITTVEPTSAPPVVIEPEIASPRQPAPQAGLLTAGDVDDLLNPTQYAQYASRFLQRQATALPFVDTRTRVTIKVVDARGRPVPFAKAEVRRQGGALHLVTAADGTASFFPRFDRIPQQTAVAISSTAGSAQRSVSLAGTRLVQVRLQGLTTGPTAMDLALVIDTTGSMGDEMAYLSAELQSIVSRLQQNVGQLDLRIGVILYRDEGDAYVVRSVPLTADVNAIQALLAQQKAGGGGDMPEAMDQALAAATRLQWRAGAAKALLLVTDAPPHDDALAASLKAAEQLRETGVQLVPVAASGVDDTAQYVLRTMAAMTQGRYVFLTDDSGVGDAHAEPDVACYLVSRLDQLLARVLAGVATGKRVEPRSTDVIRTVGSYDRGRCAVPQQS
ncbi:VWA domain-containing protein [Sphingomonas sp. R86521]|uniref:vWA domain-containing protein n=1 Tax=Sphingomonas sp. R86521 TaxID=3093860 RepID=UPI0036D224BA